MFCVYERESDGQLEKLIYEASSGKDAAAHMTALLGASPGRKLFIKRAASREIAPDDSWKDREQARFDNDTYRQVPWSTEPWFVRDHFAHPSTDKPEMLAFTQTAEHGRDDRQIRIRPGRYLESIRCPDVRHWCAVYAEAFEANELKFAETADEIQDAYENGPTSCMSHRTRDYQGHIHPVRVYAAGDIVLAYLEEDDDVTARALVWREKKIYNRIYGDDSRLRPLLEHAGFADGYQTFGAPATNGGFIGAKLLKIENENGDGWIMPYLDGATYVDDCGDHFKIARNGDYCAQNTDGTLEDNHQSCCNCGDRVDEDEARQDDDGDYWCDECWSNHHFYCQRCDEEYHDSVDHSEVDGNTWCDRCVGRHAVECVECNELSAADDHDYVECDDDLYCQRCASRHLTQCDDCSDYVRNGDAETVAGSCYCSDCAETARDNATAEIAEQARLIRAKAHSPSATIGDPRQWCMDLWTYRAPYTLAYANERQFT